MLARITRASLRAPAAVRQRSGIAVLLAVLLGVATLTGLAAHDRHFGRLNENLASLVPVKLMVSATRIADPEPAKVASAAVSRADPNEGRYRALAEFLARRYRVSQDATFDLVSFAHAAGQQLGLDPLLIIAVIAVESRFNPIAESVAGAKGLMQVIPKFHADKLAEFGGEHAVFDPRINILVGSQILKEYERRTGNTTSALQMYAGASSDAQDGYSNKVNAEKRRLQSVVNQSSRGSVRVVHGSPLVETDMN